MLKTYINGEYKIFKNGKLEYQFPNYILKHNFYDVKNNVTIQDAYKNFYISTLKLSTSIDINLSADYNPIEFPTIVSINDTSFNNFYLKDINIPVFKEYEDDNYFYFELNYFFRYDAKENLGNFTAIMAGTISASYVKDVNGNKTTFSKLEDEILDIIYTLKLKLSKKIIVNYNGIENKLKLRKNSMNNYSYASRYEDLQLKNIFALLLYGSDAYDDSLSNSSFALYNQDKNTYLENISIPIFKNNFNTILDSNNPNKFKYIINLKLSHSSFGQPLYNAQSLYIKYGSENNPMFTTSIGNIYIFNQNNLSFFDNVPFYDAALDIYVSGKFSLSLLDKFNKMKIEKDNNTQLFQDFILYDYEYLRSKYLITELRKKYKQVFLTINITDDLSKEITFDDVMKFANNYENFKKNMNILLPTELNNFYYKYTIEIPEEMRIKFPSGKQPQGGNMFNSFLNIEYCFNEGY